LSSSDKVVNVGEYNVEPDSSSAAVDVGLYFDLRNPHQWRQNPSRLSARMAGGAQAWATDDPERDWAMVSEYLRHQLDSYRAHMVEGTDRPTPRPVDLDRVVNQERPGPLNSFLYGTPEFVAAKVRESIAAAPVKTVYFWASLSGMPEDVVMRNIETVCTRLAPLLARHPVVGSHRT
jgi:hypothetical protein